MPPRFGSTWWGARWINSLHRLGGAWPSRLGRGIAYARGGAVRDLKLEPGLATALVQGRRPEPYEVRISLARLPEGVWHRVFGRLASQALYAAQLLAGEMPRDIQRVFGQCGASLFPRRPDDLRTSCTCPDVVNPCKHVAAAHYILAEALDRDPFLLFEMRGRSRDDILAALRSRRGAVAVSDSPPVAEGVPAPPIAPEEYDRSPGDLAAFGFHVAEPEVPAAALRALGPPRSWPNPDAFAATVEPLFRAATKLALEVAMAEEEGKVEEADAATRGRPSAGSGHGGDAAKETTAGEAPPGAASTSASTSTSTEEGMGEKSRGRRKKAAEVPADSAPARTRRGRRKKDPAAGG
ncbi:MAG: SWIM zinc finger family protein [Planctomycetales bacterium]|nr:SWIM zinc finger family protein [Planctomycetales bacterium]